MGPLLFKELSYKIQGAFFKVYKSLGNGFKESIYQNALVAELKHLGLTVESQKRINVYYHEEKVGVYVPDIVIAKCIMVELKSKPLIIQNDIRQFWYYLKGSEYKIGYLVNFGKPGKVEIIRRVYDTARKSTRSFA